MPLAGIFFVHRLEKFMIPIPKAVIDLAVTVLAAITSEVLAKRSSVQREASNGKEERNDRPS